MTKDENLKGQMTEYEQMQMALRKLKEESQEEFMSRLLEMVENLLEKANVKTYEPTTKEREDFRKIANIIKNMGSWF